MRIKITAMMAAAAFISAAPAFAEAGIDVTAHDGTATSLPLSTGTKIVFGDGMTVSDGSSSNSFAWSKVSKITFSSSTSAVTGVDSGTSRLALRQNPVVDCIEVVGADQLPASFAVYSLTGACRIEMGDWNGQRVDATSLPAGIYLLTINNQTIKFIKK